MSNKINIEGYLNTVNAPWGKLFYKLLWHNLECEGKRILDFGSGFGITADHFARNNEVVAVEPNTEMLDHRFRTNDYRQIVGGVEQLREMPADSFDIIFCHNVMEYLDDRIELLQEFKRILKPDGYVSLMKHNRSGKIMHNAVFEYNIEMALDLLKNGQAVSHNFGTVNEYELSDLETYCKGLFHVSRIYGIRTFFGIQNNKYKNDPEWIEKMYELESAVEMIPDFRNVAYFHHIILEVSGM